MIYDVVIAYWPYWLLGVCLAIAALEALCIMCAASRCDDRATRALDEREAQRAVRPSPAPIDVEPMR